LAFALVLVLVPHALLARSNGQQAGSLPEAGIENGLTFYAPYDGSTDARFAAGDERAANPGRHFVYTDGVAGKALLVSEKTTSVAPEYFVADNLSADQGTLAFWFKPEWDSQDPITGPQANRWFFSSRGEQGRFYFFCNRKAIAFDWYAKAATPDWKQGGWRHVALAWGPSGAALYVDGKPASDAPLKPGWAKDLKLGPTFTVGTYQTFPAGGAVDELGIWSRRLTADEVAALHGRGSKGQPLFTASQVPGRDGHPPAKPKPDAATWSPLENGSFEAGFGHGLQINMPARRSPALPSFVSPYWHEDRVAVVEGDAFHGRRALRLAIPAPKGKRPNEGSATIDTLAFRLDPTPSYVASCRVKVVSGGPVHATLNFNALRETEGPQRNLQRKIVIPRDDHEWHHLFVVGKAPSAYGDLQRLKLAFQNRGNETAQVLVDALQVAPGNDADAVASYRYSHPVTASISTDSIANILDAEGPAKLTLSLANQSRQATAADLTLEVFDLWNKQVLQRRINSQLRGMERQEQPVEIEPRKNGIYRAVLRRKGAPQVIDEMTFSILPRLEPLPALGIHAVADDYILSVAKRLGVTWQRLWDNGRATDWTNLQPEQLDAFDWRYADEIIAKSAAHGFRLLGMIAWPQTKWAWNWLTLGRPHWMHARWNPGNTDSLPDELLDDPAFRRAWLSYVHEVVSRYRDEIQYWELLNEPYLDHGPAWVARLYDITVPVIRQANPKARIVGPSTHLRPEWMKALLDQGLLGHLDVFSYHGYGMDSAALDTVRSWASHDGDRRPVFDTENSAHSANELFCGSCEGLQFTGWMPPDEAAARMSKSLVRSLAGGTKTYFYYWMVSHDAYERHGSFLNYDGALRSPAVAFATTAWLLKDRLPAGRLAVGEGIEAYQFQGKDGTSAMAALWSDGEGRSVKFPRARGIRILDMFGNPVAVGKNDGAAAVTLSAFPVYLEAASADDLAVSLKAMKIEQRQPAGS
jgi:hypothetical protein